MGWMDAIQQLAGGVVRPEFLQEPQDGEDLPQRGRIAPPTDVEQGPVAPEPTYQPTVQAPSTDTEQPQGLPSPDTSVRQRVVPTAKTPENPFVTSLQQALQNVTDLDAIKSKEDLQRWAHPDGKKDGILGNISKGILLSMRGLAPVLMDKNISDKTALGYSLGSVMAGGLGNAIAGDWDEKQKLADEKAKASGDLDQAQARYGADVTTRGKEAAITANQDKIDILQQRADTSQQRADTANRNADTNVLKALLPRVDKGLLDPAKDQMLADSLSKLAGMPLNFDPAKARVKNVKVVSDPESKTGYVIKTFEDGNVAVTIVSDPVTGKPLPMGDSRYETEVKRQEGMMATTQVRTASAEKIAAIRDATARAVEKMKIGQSQKNSIITEVARLSSLPENIGKTSAELFKEAVNNVAAIGTTPEQ